MIKTAIQDLLQAAPAVASLLGHWVFEDGTDPSPAVFTRDPAPAGCPNPVIVISQDGGVPWADCRAGDGSSVALSLRIWGDKEPSDRGLRALAYAVRGALHRKSLTALEGYLTWCSASEPQEIKDGDNYPGYLIHLEVKLRKG